MKDKTICILSLSALVCMMGGCRPPDAKGDIASGSEEEIRLINAMSGARAEAFNRGDAACIATYFADSAWLMAPDSPKKQGRAAVADYYQGIFDRYIPRLESGYETVHVSGDLAYGRGFARVWLIPKNGGDTLYSTAKYLNILERQADGGWLTTHDIWNND